MFWLKRRTYMSEQKSIFKIPAKELKSSVYRLEVSFESKLGSSLANAVSNSNWPSGCSIPGTKDLALV